MKRNKEEKEVIQFFILVIIFTILVLGILLIITKEKLTYSQKQYGTIFCKEKGMQYKETSYVRNIIKCTKVTEQKIVINNKIEERCYPTDENDKNTTFFYGDCEYWRQ